MNRNERAKPVCEACGYEGKSNKIRVVGNFSSGNRLVVDACRKCNWFLFENEQHKTQVLKAWKSR